MRNLPLAVLCLMTFGAGASIHADERDRRDDRERRGSGHRGRVTFYQDVGFRGASITLEPGETIENLALTTFEGGSRANDRISSVRVEGSVDVVVYRDSRFRGASLRITQDIRDLNDDGRTWNDVISSIQTEARRPGAARAEQAAVDRTIDKAYRDLLQKRPDQNALRHYRTKMMEDGWSESEVRDEIRRSDDYRSAVDRIIQKAYRDLLGRDADAGGLKDYRDHMLQDRWTEEDVRHSLRESQEYRDRPKSP